MRHSVLNHTEHAECFVVKSRSSSLLTHYRQMISFLHIFRQIIPLRNVGFRSEYSHREERAAVQPSVNHRGANWEDAFPTQIPDF